MKIILRNEQNEKDIEIPIGFIVLHWNNYNRSIFKLYIPNIFTDRFNYYQDTKHHTEAEE